MRFLEKHFGKGWMALTYLFLYLPLFFMIVFSFNSTRQDANFTGFSLRWYEALTRDTKIVEGFWLSVKVASITGDNAPALKVGQVVVKIDPRYFRPTEVETLLGDPSKAKANLGWVPEITLDEMVQEMVAHDLSKAKQHALLKQHGYNVAVGVAR